MGRMPELDFMETIEGKPYFPKESAEITKFIRQEKTKAKTAKIMQELEMLALPIGERAQLAYRLISSFAGEIRIRLNEHGQR